jgi:hypothetical protein
MDNHRIEQGRITHDDHDDNKRIRHEHYIRRLRWVALILAIVGLSYIVWRAVLADITNWQYGLGILLITYSIVILVWKLPKWQISVWKNNVDPKSNIEIKDYLAAENSARSTIAQILGGVFVFVGLYFTAVGLKNSAQTLELSRQGQITERYTKAVLQISNKDQPDIVIGGIYTLGRIPKESPPDHWPIMEVLTAYVRRASPIDRQYLQCDITESPEAILSRAVRPDVQAVMNVLKQRDVEYEKGLTESLNLQFSDLARVNLFGAHLDKALFDSSIMKGASFDGKATLKGSSFQFANLAYTTFETADLTGAAFRNASCLTGTNFTQANLTEADFRSSNYLLGTDFTDAILVNADFTGVDLSRAEGLRPEQIRHSKLAGATLPEYLKKP